MRLTKRVVVSAAGVGRRGLGGVHPHARVRLPPHQLQDQPLRMDRGGDHRPRASRVSPRAETYRQLWGELAVAGGCYSLPPL